MASLDEKLVRETLYDMEERVLELIQDLTPSERASYETYIAEIRRRVEAGAPPAAPGPARPGDPLEEATAEYDGPAGNAGEGEAVQKFDAFLDKLGQKLIDKRKDASAPGHEGET